MGRTVAGGVAHSLVTLGEAIAGHAAERPDAPAIVTRDRTWTYGDMAGLVAAARALVPEYSERPILAVHADTRPALGVAAAAIAAAFPVAPLDPQLPAERRALILERLAPAAVIDGGAFLAGAVRGMAHGAETLWRPSLDDTAVVFATSGSTAEPKLVPNTHRNLCCSARAGAAGQDFGPQDRYLTFGSMAHALGLRIVTDALFGGSAVIVPLDNNPRTIAHHLRHDRPTCIVAPPPVLQTLATVLEGFDPAERAQVTRVLRFVRAGSAALRPSVATRLEAVLPVPVLRSYGMSEAAKIACTPLHGGAPGDSVGRALACEIRVLCRSERPSEQGTGETDAEPGQLGEIVVRGDTVTPGYYDDEHRSASAFRDGWFRTGDLGYLDRDGYLYLHGLRDDVVSRGGELVSLATVEEALDAHPGVQSALATALPHPTLGTDVVVAYVPSPAGPPVTPAALRSFLAERLPARQVPNRLVALGELPMTPSGKPSRPLLATMLEAKSTTDSVTDGVELRLAAVWSDVLHVADTIGPGADFFTSGGDSLRLVELCTQIAAEFGVEVMPAENLGQSTLREMAALLRPDRSDGRRPYLVPIRSGSPGRLSLVLVPGAGGSVASLVRFVSHLEPGRRVLGFEAPGLYRGEQPSRRLDDLAEIYLTDLVAGLRGEPYALIGTSFGSAVAQEMAARLVERGHPPELLVLIDGPAPRAIRRPVPARLRDVLARVRDLVGLRPEGREGLDSRVRRCVAVSRRALGHHHPTPTTLPTVVLTSDEHRRRSGDPLLGWAPFLRGPTTVEEFEGSHLRMIRGGAKHTAPALDRILGEHEASADLLETAAEASQRLS